MLNCVNYSTLNQLSCVLQIIHYLLPAFTLLLFRDSLTESIVSRFVRVPAES